MVITNQIENIQDWAYMGSDIGIAIACVMKDAKKKDQPARVMKDTKKKNMICDEDDCHSLCDEEWQQKRYDMWWWWSCLFSKRIKNKQEHATTD